MTTETDKMVEMARESAELEAFRAAHPAPVAAQPSQAPVVQAGNASAPAVRMLTEDEVAQATEDGERSFRRWTQGVRGQTLMPQDSPTFHYVMAGAAKALAVNAAIIADLAADVEQDGFRLVSVNAGFTELLEALDRADRKGYMPDAIYSAYEGFECRDPASTVAALKAERDAALARVAELEKDAARYQKLLDLWNGRDMRELFGIEDFAALDAAPQPQQEQP